MAMFGTREEAEDFFGDGIEVEECECCGEWTASRADAENGGIVGPCVDPYGDNAYDRICESCDAKVDFEAKL